MKKKESSIAESLKKQLDIRPPARATSKQFIMTENKWNEGVLNLEQEI